MEEEIISLLNKGTIQMIPKQQSQNFYSLFSAFKKREGAAAGTGSTIPEKVFMKLQVQDVDSHGSDEFHICTWRQVYVHRSEIRLFSHPYFFPLTGSISDLPFGE